MVICLSNLNSVACTLLNAQLAILIWSSNKCAYLRRRILQKKKSVSKGFGCLGVDCESIGQILNCECLHEILESRAEDMHRRIFCIARFYSRLRKYIYVQKEACRRSVYK
jgi:hypothetical protein